MKNWKEELVLLFCNALAWALVIVALASIFAG